MKFFIVDGDQTAIELMTALLEAAGRKVGSSVAGANGYISKPIDTAAFVEEVMAILGENRS